MAYCAGVDGATGYVQLLPTPVSECSTLILLDASEWGGSSVWAIPTAGEMETAYAAGLLIPLTLYFVAYAAGSLISFFRS